MISRRYQLYNFKGRLAFPGAASAGSGPSLPYRGSERHVSLGASTASRLLAPTFPGVHVLADLPPSPTHPGPAGQSAQE